MGRNQKLGKGEPLNIVYIICRYIYTGSYYRSSRHSIVGPLSYSGVGNPPTLLGWIARLPFQPAWRDTTFTPTSAGSNAQKDVLNRNFAALGDNWALSSRYYSCRCCHEEEEREGERERERERNRTKEKEKRWEEEEQAAALQKLLKFMDSIVEHGEKG